LLDEASDAVDQNRSLARSSSRHHQHGSMNMLNRFTLAIVGNKWGRMSF
jgi:hypothetical protein